MIILVYICWIAGWFAGSVAIIRSCRADDTKTFLSEALNAVYLFVAPILLYYWLYLPAIEN
jgi:hypothetical protein